MGQVFQAMGKFEPALAAYDRAAALPGPAQMDAIANRGVLFMEFGRKAEALKALEEAAKAFPNSPGILFGQTDLKRFEPGDPLIGRMQALLAREGISLADRATLHFGLGKAFLDIGDSAEAFRHYDEGNRLKRSTFAYDADANERWMAGIAEVFSPALLEAKAGLRRAVGPAGLRARHAALGHDADRADPRLASVGPRRGRAQAPALAHRRDRGLPGLVREPDAGATEGAGRGLSRPCDPDGGRPAACRRQDAVELPALRPDPAHPAGRAHHPLPARSGRHLPLLLHQALRRRAGLHLRPDGARPVPPRLSGADGALASALPASHLLEVDYEAVVDDTEGQARRMLDFLGLPWDEAVLKFHETERPVRTASVNQVRQPIYRTSVGRWRKHAAQLGPLLEALGVPAA